MVWKMKWEYNWNISREESRVYDFFLSHMDGKSSARDFQIDKLWISCGDN